MKATFKRKAFTLIELLIVIAIIGILFIVLVSKVDFATDKAKTTGVQTDFRSFQVAFEQVARENAGFNTLGWDTGDIKRTDFNTAFPGYSYNNELVDAGDGVRNSYDVGDLNLNGELDANETWTGRKFYTETWTSIYTLDKPGDASDKSAYIALENAINKNLDPKLHITINPDTKEITMANGYQDPWTTEYHGFYLSNAAVDGKDRGAILMYSDGPNKQFGSAQVIANGVVTIGVPQNNIQGQDDLSILTIYTYFNGYGEVKTTTSGFSQNQNSLTGGNGNDMNVVPEGPVGGSPVVDLENIEGGLYQSGTNYQTRLYTWQELIDLGWITSAGRAVDGMKTNLAGDLKISNTITSISSSAFRGCTGLTQIAIPESVTSIGKFAFLECTRLQTVHMSDAVTSIGEGAFQNCTSLMSVTFGDSTITLSTSNPSAFNYLSISGLIDMRSFIEIQLGMTFDELTTLREAAITEGTWTEDNEAEYTEISTALNLYDGKLMLSCEAEVADGCDFNGWYIGNEQVEASTYLMHIVEGSATIVADAGAHLCSYTQQNTSSKYLASKSTCTTKSTYYYSCSSCGEKGTETFEYGSLGDHSYENCICTKCGEPQYEYFTFTELEDGTYSIAAKNVNNIPASVIIPSEYNDKAVTAIGNEAFKKCTSLTNITIPDSVTSIGNYAFSVCQQLTTITFGENSQLTSIGKAAFSSCKKLTTIAFGENSRLASIGEYAFSTCDSLTSIEIPESVTSIGYSVFYYCSSLTSITVDEDNTVYYSSGNCIIEKETNTLIAGCNASVIPNDIIIIGNYAFHGCTSLKSITIPDSVTSIDLYAFGVCQQLTTITFGENSQLTTIVGRAFEGCTSLTSITIPDSVTSIGEDTFHGCTSLTSITIPDSVTSIGNYAFYYCTSLTSITIPDSVTSIGNYAFYGCTSLTSITIPDSVTRIRNYAFQNCTSLNTITFDGTLAQWNAITFDGSSWNKNVPATTVQCSNGTVRLS